MQIELSTPIRLFHPFTTSPVCTGKLVLQRDQSVCQEQRCPSKVPPVQADNEENMAWDDWSRQLTLFIVGGPSLGAISTQKSSE